MTMPCQSNNPALDFSVRKKWTAVSLRMVRSAAGLAGIDFLAAPYVELALRGEGRFFLRNNAQGEDDSWYVHGAAMNILSAVSQQETPAPECTMSNWGSCEPADLCERNIWTWSCTPRVTVGNEGWWNVQDVSLMGEVGAGVVADTTAVDGLTGITMTMYCGPKDQFSNTGAGPSNQSFRTCLEQGVQTNARLRAAEPWKLYFPGEVVVLAMFHDITDRQCQPVASGSAEAADSLCHDAYRVTTGLDAHLSDDMKVSGDGVYQGLHVGAGWPKGIPDEVHMRPEDVLEATDLMSRT